jgi:hypothetical protein
MADKKICDVCGSEIDKKVAGGTLAWHTAPLTESDAVNFLVGSVRPDHLRVLDVCVTCCQGIALLATPQKGAAQ